MSIEVVLRLASCTAAAHGKYVYFLDKASDFFWLRLLAGKLVLRRAHPLSMDGDVLDVLEIACPKNCSLLSARVVECSMGTLRPCAS